MFGNSVASRYASLGHNETVRTFEETLAPSAHLCQGMARSARDEGETFDEPVEGRPAYRLKAFYRLEMWDETNDCHVRFDRPWFTAFPTRLCQDREVGAHEDVMEPHHGPCSEETSDLPSTGRKLTSDRYDSNIHDAYTNRE